MNEWGKEEVPKHQSCTIMSNESLLFVGLMFQTLNMNCTLYNLRGITPSSLKSQRSAGTSMGKGVTPQSHVTEQTPLSLEYSLGNLTLRPEILDLRTNTGGKGRGLCIFFFQVYLITEFSIFEVGSLVTPGV